MSNSSTSDSDYYPRYYTDFNQDDKVDLFVLDGFDDYISTSNQFLQSTCNEYVPSGTTITINNNNYSSTTAINPYSSGDLIRSHSNTIPYVPKPLTNNNKSSSSHCDYVPTSRRCSTTDDTGSL